MNELTLDDLLEKVGEYNPGAIDKIIEAYNYAADLHEGQFRQSGEPYIIHPLNVAYILAEAHLDSASIMGALLHDVIEDTPVTKEDITHDFDKEVAMLVDGVTKLSKMNFSSKQACNMANTRKIVMGCITDIRIILIKLADRLHNMRTLQYKSPFKQQENSLETLDIYVPLANYVGAYRIKTELEDLAFSYLKPDKYKELSEIKLEIEDDSRECLNEMLYTIKDILLDRNIPNEIKVRTKNIYGIYERMEKGLEISDIHDLLVFKIMVDDIANCYQTLGIIHSQYNPVNNHFKDYLYNPKKNMYRSIHTTVFAPDERLVQAQIRTFDMDKIASFGLPAYWNIEGNSRYETQQQIAEKFQFYKSLKQIDKMFSNNEEFVNQVKKELFSDKVYACSPKGQMIELPKGSTVIDYAYAIHTELGNTMVGAKVNEHDVPFGYELNNDDIVKIITSPSSPGPTEEWLNETATTKAKRRIQQRLGRAS